MCISHRGLARWAADVGLRRGLAARNRHRHREHQGRPRRHLRHRFLASETIAHSMDLPRPGWAEVDAEAMWWREVCAISAAADRPRCPRARRWPRCASAASDPAWCCATTTLRPLRPAILYGVDTRATAEIESLTAEFGEPTRSWSGRARCCPARRSGPKLEWVRRHEPEVFEQGDRLVRVELLHRGQAHRRVRDGSPHRQPVRSAVRDARLRLESPNGRNASADTCRCPGWCGPARSSARVHAGGGRGHRGTRRHSGVGGHGRCLLRGVLGRRPQARRPDADVRLDDVSGADHRRATTATRRCGRRRASSAAVLALAAGTSTAGSLIGWLQAVTGGAHRSTTLMAEAQACPARQRGTAGAALPRRRAHARSSTRRRAACSQA